jgi:3-oxoacyl-[acyl-carrier-protein] synthase II
MLERGYTKASPFTVPMMITDMPAGIVAIKYGLKGLNKCVTTACATGTHSIGDSFRAIQYGEADIIVSGGTESAICDLGISAFNCARTLSKRNDDPEKASRPYDKDRDGFVMGEGAGVLILEELEHALNRGAKIYAEVLGYGQNCDAYDMVCPNPQGEGAADVMQLAMDDGGVKKEEISYINTHGTSTHIGDIAESNAIVKVFGDKNENKNLLVSSTKSMIGHLLGAAGAVESIISIKAMQEGIVPPTINLENQDEEVANLDYVPNVARKQELNKVMSNSFGFGGCNAVLVFGRYEK